MRLTVNLKEEYYQAARAYSQAENVSLSQAVNRLLAIAFQKSHTTEKGETTGSRVRSRFPTSKGAKKVTSAIIEAIERDA